MASSPPGSLGSTSNQPSVDAGTSARTESVASRTTGTNVKDWQHIQKRACTGVEQTYISPPINILSYTGDLPSPLQIMWYTPRANESLKLFIPDSEIRGWIRDAAAYHRIPHILLALILQQENAPSTSKFRQFLQFGERSTQTFLAILDEALFDAVSDRFAGGSTGAANMKRSTMLSAISYSERLYGRPPVPHDVKTGIFGFNTDTRISGDDFRCDLYYCAAHLRQLIDGVTHCPCHDGGLSLAQLQKVLRSYNGSGPLAEKYAADAMQLLRDAIERKRNLYFYES